MPQPPSATVDMPYRNPENALVTAIRKATSATDGRSARLGPVVGTIQSDGSFHILGLVPGVYRLCTQTPRTAWLNSCEWGGAGMTLTLASPEASIPVLIVLIRGAVVNVRVNDVGQLLPTYEANTPGAHLLMGVNVDGQRFRHAALASKDLLGRTYQLTVPFDRSVTLTVGSSFFRLADASSKPLPKLGNLLPILIQSSRGTATTATGTGDLVLNLIGRY